MNIIIYTRVNPQEQFSNQSEDTLQLNLCEKLCGIKCWKVIEVYQDNTKSDTDLVDRPILVKAVNHCIKADAALMVSSLDKLSTTVYNISGFTGRHMFGKKTPQLIIAESPYASELEISVRACLIQEETRKASDRTPQT